MATRDYAFHGYVYYKVTRPVPWPTPAGYTWWNHYSDRLSPWDITPKQVRDLSARKVKKLYQQLKNGYQPRTTHRSRVQQHHRCADVVRIYS